MKYFLIGLGLGAIFIAAIWRTSQSRNIVINNTNQTQKGGLNWQIIDKKTQKTARPIWAPILNYHYIRDNPNLDDTLGFSLSVTPENFAKQLDWLSENGFQTVTLNDLSAAIDEKKSLPPKPAILTFDDGYQDFYQNAYPILKAKNMQATVYVIVDFLNDKDERYLTGEQIAKLSRSGLVTIGSHSLSHANLTGGSLINVKKEIYESKKRLEKITDRPVLHFAYPSGKYSETVAGLVRLAGYKTAVSTKTGSWHLQSDRYHLARIRISGETDLASFTQKLSPDYD